MSYMDAYNAWLSAPPLDADTRAELIDIADAYEQGLISREALLKAKKYHDQCQKEIAAAWGK